jgi:lipopolysaccharide export system permease protein
VVALRLMGFVTSIVGVTVPFFIILQYALLAATIGLGLFAISRGMIIEPPAFLTNSINTLIEYFRRRVSAMRPAQ